MGLLMFLYFIGKCFDFLAWPFFALVYPLCASIKAIESNSTSDIKQLTTYWVVFSIISIFDLAITKILPWVPFWPYFKLMVICWLVLPYFDGASYMYGTLVRHCLAVFINPKAELVMTKDVDLQVPVDSCIKSPEQPIFNNSRESNVDAELNKTSADSQKNLSLKSSTDQSTLSAYQVQHNGYDKEMGSRALTVRDPFPQPLPLNLQNEVQREWSCGLCHVTTQSESSLQSHLKGMRHKTNVDALSGRMMAQHNLKAGHQYKQSKTTRAENQYGQIWCDKCAIWCSGAVSMVSHLTGKKHVDRLRELAVVGNSETASLS